MSRAPSSRPAAPPVEGAPASSSSGSALPEALGLPAGVSASGEPASGAGSAEDAAPTPEPFWRTTPLAAMTTAQWESLCDGCGRCCLVKLEDEDTGAIAYTDVACRLFDTATCRCSDYPNRSEKVSDCVRLTPEEVARLSWLPPTCAYRLLDEGRDLPAWHPLVSGDPASVQKAGVSVAGKVAGLEGSFGLFELVDHIVAWPARFPRGAKVGLAKAKTGTGAKRHDAGPNASQGAVARARAVTADDA